MTRAFWTGLAILGALLVETSIGYLVPAPGQLFDPFLLVVVYAALVGGETRGMLTGVAAGWVQDVMFGGRVLGLVALAKLLVGFVLGLAGGRLLINSTPARALAVLLATFADGLLVPWLASVFTLELSPLGPLGLLGRATVNATVAGALFALVERRARRSPS